MKYKNIMILLAAFAMTATGCSDFWRENRWLKEQKQSFSECRAIQTSC